MKKLLAILSGLIIAGLVVGCGGGDKDKDTKAQNTKTQVATKFVPKNKINEDLSGVVLKVGAASSKNAQGVVEAAGLADTPYKVEFSNLRGGNLVMEALAANQLDAGCGSQIPPIFASLANNGGNFKIIAIRRGSTLDQELIVGPKTKDTVKSVADLKGKKVGYIKSTTAHYFLYKMLQKSGLKWEDIDAVPLSTSAGLSAVLTGDIAALASYGNTITVAKDKGSKTLESAANILSGDYYWYATPNTIKDKKKHAALVDYLDRINEANEILRKDPDKWAAYSAKETNRKHEDIKKDFLRYEEQIKGRIAPLNDKTVASEQDIIDTFVSLKVLKSRIEAKNLFDASFNEEISKYTIY